MMDKKIYWEVKKDGDVYACGTKETFPNATDRKDYEKGGYKIYVDGKVYR